MPWYVYALVDAVPSGRPGRGLSGPLRVRDIPGGFAVVERRADVPPPEFGSLSKHQAVVMRLADAVPAILPVRFGTLLDDEALDEALGERAEELREAFALVRHRVQFTWRRHAATSSSQVHAGSQQSAHSAPSRRAETDPDAATPGPGAQTSGPGAAYLRRAARGANPAPPPALNVVRARLHAFVVRERFQPAASGVPDTLYQLIEKSAQTRYRAMADAIVLTTSAFTVSGPWPPFAFAPEVL
jgi:hypothetical protein